LLQYNGEHENKNYAGKNFLSLLLAGRFPHILQLSSSINIAFPLVRNELRMDAVLLGRVAISNLIAAAESILTIALLLSRTALVEMAVI